MENIDIVWALVILFFGTILFVFFGQSVTKIVKAAWYGVFYVGAGAFGLFILNLVLDFFNQHIAINFVTALITGILGIPGIIALLLIKIFIAI